MQQVYPQMALFPKSGAFQTPSAGTDIYKSSFFFQTIRDWNSQTNSLISASGCAKNSVTKFTSLVRARD